MATTFDVLGPVRVLRDGAVVTLRSARVRDVLAVLLSHAPHAVSWERLVQEVWQDHPPANPKAALQTSINRLRATVGDDVVLTRPHGYALDVRPADLTAFDRLVAEAQEAEGVDRIGPARAGLVLWRGAAYADVTTPSVSLHEAPRLEERRLQLVELLGDALLGGDQPSQALELAEQETVTSPLRESLWSLRIRALAALGRRRDALEAYDRFAERLAEDEGLDPSPELADLRQRVLLDDPTVARPPSRGPTWTVHEQLPLDTPGFVARCAEIDRVITLVRDPEVPLVVLSGMGGVGKSSLAVHVAHRLREDFPDGQWFLELRGSRPDPRSSADVLVDLLRLAGVEDAGIPSDHGARESLLRGRLAGRRLLLVLDDARDAEQVRPLLPGTPESIAVLVTSRAVLDGLVALDDAEPHVVQPLDPDGSRDLLARALGDRADDHTLDPAQLAGIVRACAGLPLALRIVAANLRMRREPAEAVVEQLNDGRSLDPLRIPGDERAGVDAVFSSSYQVFDADHRRCLRLVAHLPGDDFAAASVAALLEGDDATVTLMLRRLADHHLLQQTRPGRYRIHDLVRRFALTLVDDEATSALQAYLGWVLERCTEATARHHAVLTGLDRPPLRRRTFADDAAGRRWLESEGATLVASVRAAAEDEALLSYAWHITDTLRHYLYMTGRQRDWQTMSTAGLAAARRAGDRMAEAVMLQSLSNAIDSMGDHQGALGLCLEALQLFRAEGDAVRVASTLNHLGITHLGLGHLGESHAAFHESIEVYRSSDRAELSTVTMTNFAMALLASGDLVEAETVLHDGLRIDRDSDRTIGIVAKLIALAEVHRHRGALAEARRALSEAESWTRVVATGFHAQALACQLAALYRTEGRPKQAVEMALQAEAVARDAGDPWHLAQSLKALGDAFAADGAGQRAARTYRQAAEVSETRGYQHLSLEIVVAHAGLRAGTDPEALQELEAAARRARTEGRRLVEADALTTLLAWSPRHPSREGHHERLRELVRATGYVPQDWSLPGRELLVDADPRGESSTTVA